MTPQHLLDTNTASYAIKGTYPEIDRRLEQVPLTSLFVTVVTEAELRYGLARRPAATRLVEAFLLAVTILPWDSEAARLYAVLRAKLERRGKPMANLDMMIGSHALSLGAVLVTNDDAFRRIENLKLANWTKA